MKYRIHPFHRLGAYILTAPMRGMPSIRARVMDDFGNLAAIDFGALAVSVAN